ncbi:MAG: maltose alpha-D-glucosyltransferase [Acidimicrobiia bacterium]|nr:maltose alpha-D-glucosyltransferase [Acidimicrobiia bacterium]
MTEHPRRLSTSDPQWYRDAIIYETHVRAFKDSNGDGIGDFPGLTSKLDYIQQLGVTAIWLLPFYPSPLRDDGYDIADYMDVHPSYGTLTDFTTFLEEAHRRDMRVVTELVINHTSDQHPWFRRARLAAPGTEERDFYVWSDTADRYNDVRIIFQDTETSNWAWDPVADAYYWHRFFTHQPDLNYDLPAVLEAVLEVLGFWLDMGVDGLRLDAIPYLFEREGTNGENLPETHKVLKEIRAHVDANYDDRMLIAEANQWPEDAVEYFGNGDECHMSFHFPLMPRLYLALHRGDRLPIVDILEQTPDIPETAQWATFLRNHDELTLEMVTGEERELLWHAYAPDRRARLNLGIRRRLAPLLGNDRRRLELMYGLLLSLGGTPALYYGDELGMGDNIFLADRDGVRTPMQWSGDRNAGFSTANPQSLYLPVIIDPEFHFETVNVEAQHANPNSLLWWVRKMLLLRRRHPVFGRGELKLLHPTNQHVLAFLRVYEDETMLVVANLSTHSQYVELDLGQFVGTNPIELIGGTEFPAIGDLPYLLTLGPHAFFWFELGRDAAVAHTNGPIELSERLDALADADHPLVTAVHMYLNEQPWYRGSGDGMISLRDAVPIGDLDQTPRWWLGVFDRPGSLSGQSTTYALPIGIAVGDNVQESNTGPKIADITWLDTPGVVFDATGDTRFHLDLLKDLSERGKIASQRGNLELVVALETGADDAAHTGGNPGLISRRDGSATIALDDTTVLRLFCNLEPGTSPGVEVRRFLTERAGLPVVAPLGGWINYNSDEQFTVGVFEPRGHVSTTARDLFEHMAATYLEGDKAALKTAKTRAQSLADTIAAVHRALAGPTEDPALVAEPLTSLGQRSLYQTLRSSIAEGLVAISRRAGASDHLGTELREVIGRRPELLAELDPLLGRTVRTMLTRVHGDMRLDVFSWTGEIFRIHDFSGDRSLRPAQRRLKRSPLRDVAQLMRSIDYAGLRAEIDADGSFPDEASGLIWSDAVRESLLTRYIEAMAGSPALPEDPADVALLLRVFELSRAVHELRWEVEHRPTWIPVALQGLEHRMGWTTREG